MLALHNIHKSFDDKPVLRGVSLTIAVGEVVVLLGPSGCGKTTLLRIMAGLETAVAGDLLLDGQDLTRLPVHKRNFGFVFQDYALFPHKNVRQNVAFGLRMQNWSAEQIDDRVTQMLDLVGLSGFGERPIYELSGGEQQRVALARSLAPAPRLLLLDEPLGALDRALRERLMVDLRTILKQVGTVLGQPEGITAVYVTHDQAEAFAIADRVVVMNAGQIEQEGRPTDLYRQPRTPFVARFLGMENIIDGQITALNPPIAQTTLGLLQLNAIPDLQLNQTITVLIRPEAAQLGEDGVNIVNGRLQTISFRGRYQQAIVQVGETALKLEFDTAVALPDLGTNITFTLDPATILRLESA